MQIERAAVRRQRRDGLRGAGTRAFRPDEIERGMKDAEDHPNHCHAKDDDAMDEQ